MTHVLIIDDSPTEAYVFRVMLEKNDIQVSVATNGEEGIDMAKHLLPDLILMDIVMPKKNGFQATRDINRNATTSHIPIIIITTKDQESDKIWGMRQGAINYVVKPTNEKELMGLIVAALN